MPRRAVATLVDALAHARRARGAGGRRVRIEVVGHADADGPPASNGPLSVRRAQHVLALLRGPGPAARRRWPPAAPAAASRPLAGPDEAPSSATAACSIRVDGAGPSHRRAAAMIEKKICMLGASGVGKTSLVSRFVSSIFSDKYLTTVGVKVDKKVVAVDDTQVTLLLWDIYGQDEFQTVKPAYLRGASGYLLVADGTRAGDARNRAGAPEDRRGRRRPRPVRPGAQQVGPRSPSGRWTSGRSGRWPTKAGRSSRRAPSRARVSRRRSAGWPAGWWNAEGIRERRRGRLADRPLRGARSRRARAAARGVRADHGRIAAVVVRPCLSNRRRRAARDAARRAARARRVPRRGERVLGPAPPKAGSRASPSS